MPDMKHCPKRVQIQSWRKPGGKKPETTVVVARPSIWGNPFKVGDDGVPDRATAVQRYRDILLPYTHHGPAVGESKMHDYMLTMANINEVWRDLRGKNLACYCPLDEPCHADVLLEIANQMNHCHKCACTPCQCTRQLERIVIRKRRELQDAVAELELHTSQSEGVMT